MAHRYQGNPQDWSGHRGRGGNFKGQNYRGRGGWQHKEHKRTSEGFRERHDQRWNQNSPGPSTSHKVDTGRSQRHSQEYQPGSRIEAGGSGTVDQQRNPLRTSGMPIQMSSNPLAQSHGQSGEWQQQQQQSVDSLTGGWPTQNQSYVQNQFGNQQTQMVTSQQHMPMPPFNQNPSLAPVHTAHPGDNIYPGAPQMHQEQGHPGSFVPSNSFQPQFAPQQQLQPNRTQQYPIGNSGTNPMMPPQNFHPPPPPLAAPELPPQNSTIDMHMPPPSVSHRDTQLHSVQHAAAHQNFTSRDKTQRMLDEEWVAHFVSGVGPKPTLPQSDCNGTMMPVSDGRQAIRHYLVLLKTLEQLRDSLITCMESNDETWRHECNKANQIKAQLSEAKEKIQDPSFVLKLSDRLAKIKKKRESIARRKKRQYLAGIEKEDRKRRVNEKIDAVLAKEQKAIQDAKNEKALQKEADITLFEVRKKKQDADKTLEMLRALTKLRNVRKEAAAQKGAYTTSESDKNFEDAVSKLEAMMNKARSTYRDEEQTMLVMLEEEQEENKERQLEIIRQRQRESALKAVRKRKEMLFGKDEPVGPDDPMFPFQQFYSSAENNLPTLIEIRSQWDSFLVPPDDPNGSGIPADWVMPSEPSGKEWASVLQDT